MPKMKDLEKALEDGMLSNDFESFFRLIKQNKKLAKSPYGPNRATLLHKLAGTHIESLKHDVEDLANESPTVKYKVTAESYIELITKFIDEIEDINLNATDSKGRTPLHYAIEVGNRLAVAELVQFNEVDLTIEDEEGNTPLKLAKEKRYRDIIELIIESFSKDEVANRVAPLEAAFEEGMIKNDFTKLIEAIEADPEAVHFVYGPNQITLLHKIVTTDIYKLSFDSMEDNETDYTVDQETYSEMLTTLIDSYGVDLDAKDAEGNTLLLYAIKGGNTHAVKILLANEDINPDIKNNDGVSPLQLASLMRFEEIEQMILSQTDLSSKLGVALRSDETTKGFQRRRKHEIIDSGPMQAIKSEKPTAVEAIQSQLYFEDKDLMKKFEGLLESLKQDPILGPIIQMIGFCAYRGVITEVRREMLTKQLQAIQHGADFDVSDTIKKFEKELNKKFKIVCVDHPDVSSLKVFVEEPLGLYTGKETIFVATAARELNQVLATMMHEATHFVVRKLFENDCEPFPNDAEYNPLRDKMYSIVEDVRLSLKNIEGNIYDKMDLEAFKDISAVFQCYSKNKWAKELIVRVPSIIARLGPEKGMEWLEHNTPKLLQFFQLEVILKISQYLTEKNASEFLSQIQLEHGTPTSLYKLY